jgi:hypothetical protein
MGVMTYGTYLIYDTTAPTSSWDPSAHTEGVDYIKFQNSPKVGWGVTFNDGIMDLMAGWSIAITLGDFAEQLTIDDVATRTQLAVIKKFLKTVGQPLYSPYLYLITITADGSPPTCEQQYKNSATPSDYLPVRASVGNGTWDEKTQLYQVRVVVKACWPA